MVRFRFVFDELSASNLFTSLSIPATVAPMLGFDRRQSGESGGRRELTGVDASSSATGASRTGSAAAVEVPRPQPFAVEVRRRDDVVIVQPHGELDLATV